MKQEKMVNVYVPALVALLTRAEELTKRPLSESEVLRIRDNAEKVSQPLSVMPAFLQQRGYHDLYAPEAWEEWQLYREGKIDLSIRECENT